MLTLVFLAAMGLTALAGGCWPDRIAGPALELAFGVVILTALSLLGSVVLSATANGIAVLGLRPPRPLTTSRRRR